MPPLPVVASQIVKFIIESSGQGNKPMNFDGMDITGGGCDPFTGGGGGSGGGGSRPPMARPPAVPLSELPITGGGVDPFTGSDAASRLAASAGACAVGGPIHEGCDQE